MKKTKSAGAILISKQGKIALVNNRGLSWTFPKGHIEKNETAQEAMFREVTEETGIVDTLCLKELGTYERPQIKRDDSIKEPELKEITMFLCLTDELTLAPLDKENPEAKWVAPDKVTDILTHAKDREFYLNAKTEITYLAEMNRPELLEALDVMANNADLAIKQPELERQFREEYLYEDPENYEGTKALWERYGYKFTPGVWKLQQLQFQLANEASNYQLKNKK